MLTKRKQTPAQLGYVARLAGKAFSQNPYSYGMNKGCWAHGWLAANTKLLSKQRVLP